MHINCGGFGVLNLSSHETFEKLNENINTEKPKTVIIMNLLIRQF